MNVLHFVTSNNYHPFFTDLAHHLQGPRISLFIGSLECRGELQAAVEPDGVETIALDCKRRRDYPAATLRLARWLRERRIDVVHTHLSEASAVGLAAARLAGVPGRVMTRHHSDERRVYGSRKGVMVDRLIGHCLARNIVAISKEVKRALMSIDGIRETKIRMVPNGYDWERVRSTVPAAAAIRRQLGIENALVLCHVGRLVWVPAQKAWMKGQDTLLRAFAAAHLPENSRLLIVGGGPQEELRTLAAELGIEGQCRFLGHRRDIFDVIAASDLLVHPSLHEAQCQVLIEAMALGVPVISSTVGAAEEMVIPGNNGWLVPPRDEPALIRALGEAVSDRQRLRAYGLAGQELVRRLYPIERMTTGYEALYVEQLQGQRAEMGA